MYRTFGFFVIILACMACTEEEALSAGSNLDTTATTLSGLDKWINDNYVAPYNIEIVYRWEAGLTDQTRYLFPPTVDSVKSLLEIVKSVWIDSYNAVGGENFIKEIAPRQLVLAGGINRNPSGTITLGVAEGGKRITLFNVNLVQKSSRASINQFLNTIQHEYAHILNQTKPFDLTYGQITPIGYTAQWFNKTDAESQEDGFISAYAQSNPSEDFAEMVSVMLSLSNEEWKDLINNIGPSIVDDAGEPIIDPDGKTTAANKDIERARSAIRTKEARVVDYYKNKFDLDFYALQEKVYNEIIRLTE